MVAHSSYFRRKNSKKGLALSTTMAVCIVLAILVALLVSMASLNITTTQATVNQRSAYVEAKSAISFVESFYSKNGDKIPGQSTSGSGNACGEGLVVFKSGDIADGASFYETKAGFKSQDPDGTIHFATSFMDDQEVERLKEGSAGTYVVVKNVVINSENVLVLEAFSKYGNGQSYSLKKQYKIGGEDIEDNPFTGSPIYTGKSNTRFVRFHVRSTTAFQGTPYFYMWYNGISPAEGKADHNPWVTSSIESKLTHNKNYKEIRNGSWGGDGPEGACAMSYEGSGWYVTQKTLNLTRNVNYVNGIVTRTGATRSISENENDWNAQSFEFFGIPIPDESQTSKENGMDIYFELVTENLHDMQNIGGKDALAEKYRSFAGGSDGGREQLNKFVKWVSQYYNVYVKTETAIMHYRKAKVINNSACPDDFTYEGYGWCRRTTHNFSDQFRGYSYTTYRPISQNQFGQEKIYESFVVEAEDGTTRQFATEEEANRWLINKGDLNAGNYIEVNVNAANQPVDNLEEHGAKITYEADYYSGTATVPVHPATVTGTEAAQEPEVTTLEGNDEELEFTELGANTSYGSDFYVIGPDLDNAGEGMTYDSLNYQMQPDGSGNMTVVVPATPGVDVRFKVIQKQDQIYYDYRSVDGTWKPVSTVQQDEWGTLVYTTRNVCTKKPFGGYRAVTGYVSNYWGDSANSDGYKSFTPSTDKVLITFNIADARISCSDAGGYGEDDNYFEPVSATKKYSVIGWCNDWGTSRDGETSPDGSAYYNYTFDMYTDINGTLTYSDTSIRARTGEHPKFMVAIRDEGVNVGSQVDWTRVIDANGNPAQTSSDPAQRYVMPYETAMTPYEINVPADEKGRDCECYITFSFVPDEEDGGKYKPVAKATPVDEAGKFYVIGQFNGWYPEEKEAFPWEQANSYQMQQVRLEGRKLVYTYKIPSVQEGADEGLSYSLRVIGAESKMTAEIEPGKHQVDYTKTWGSSVETDVTRNENGIERTYNAQIAMGQDDVTYSLTKRSIVTVTFKYDPLYPDESEVSVSYDSSAVEDAEVTATYVGFHNEKLDNVNESTNHLKSSFNTPWEHVYATYYTEATGFNCRPVTDTTDSVNYWTKVPVDAEYVYFSNKATNIYKDFHSADFQFTTDIKNESFSESSSVIFFPIDKEPDKTLKDVERTKWTIGDSKDYYEWINTKTHIKEVNTDMAYYGSTQCNYYNAPFVNVLNMLVESQPKPAQKYAFSSYPWSSFTVGGWERGSFANERVTTKTINFNANNYVNYRGEKYYYTKINFCSSSFMLLCNPISGYTYNENNDYMYGYLFEDQMSLERNSSSRLKNDYKINTSNVDMSTKLAYPSDGWGNWIPKDDIKRYWDAGALKMRSGATSYYSRIDTTQYFTSSIDQMESGRRTSSGGYYHSAMYMYNRAGGAFVSNYKYKEGTYVSNGSGGLVWKQYDSPFNYQDYTPTWYTYRIPVCTDVQIEHVQIVSTEDAGHKWISVAGSDSNDETNTYKFEPVAESSNVNRPIYFYRTAKKENQVFTYNLKEGSVDGTADDSGNVTTSVYFANYDDEAWDVSKLCVHAYTPTSDGVYLKQQNSSGSSFYQDTTDKNRSGDYYYKFDFKEGEYCYFQFYEGDPSAEGLKNAAKKSKVLYLTGEELGQHSDYYEDKYSGLDERTTRILCEGSASGFTWYMHPKTSVMHAYLDMDTVNQMLTDDEYFGYNPSSGTYSCHGEVKVSAFGSRTSGAIHDLMDKYNNGNTTGGWTVNNLTSVGQGLLKAASDYIDVRGQARMFVSDNIKDADTKDWTGPNQMVYMEGELMEESAFEYDSEWTNNFRSVYAGLEKGGNRIYDRNMNENAFNSATDSLKIWIQNPIATMKSDAVMVIVDNNRYNGKGGLNEKTLGLYVKDAITGWRLFTNEIYQTTQDNFYCFIFLLPKSETSTYDRPFTVATEQPHEYWVNSDNVVVNEGDPTAVGTVDMLGDAASGVKIQTVNITPGTRYRCNTYYDTDSPNYFHSDSSKETKTYTGTEIRWAADAKDSPTKDLNKFVSLSSGSLFQLHFMYDTTIKTPSIGTYTIRAGYYEISSRNYPGFYDDFGSSPTDEHALTGINVYTETAKKFFTEPLTSGYMSYGMASAKNYSTWNGSRGKTGKDIDIMASKMGGTTGQTLSAIEPNNRVNFRWNGVKGSDTLTLKNRSVSLRGKTVTIAMNTIDLRNSGSYDFFIDTGKIIFLTDVTVKKPDGTTSIIEAGVYNYIKSDETLDHYKVSLKSTTVQDRDWRVHFQRVEQDSGNKLIGGMFVDG